MTHAPENTPDWTGQIRMPLFRSALLATGLHPACGLLWLQADGAWIPGLLDAARAQPMQAFGALWLALLALSPWKSVRTDLTHTSLKG